MNQLHATMDEIRMKTDYEKALEIVGTCRACLKPCAKEEDGFSWCCGDEVLDWTKGDNK